MEHMVVTLCIESIVVIFPRGSPIDVDVSSKKGWEIHPNKTSKTLWAKPVIVNIAIVNYWKNHSTILKMI